MFAVYIRACFAAALLLLSAAAGAAAMNSPEIDIKRLHESMRVLTAAEDTATPRLMTLDEDPLIDAPGRSAAPLVRDQRVQDHVNRIGWRLASESDRLDREWRFGVVESFALNAYALPDGSVLLTRSLYEALDNEAQLAAVLAYAIAIGAQDIAARLAQQQAKVTALSTLPAAIPRGRGMMMEQVVGAGAQLFARKLEREAVYEADRAGIALLQRAGYRPDAMLEVLDKLQALRPVASPTPSLHATHPLPSDRSEMLKKALKPLDTR